MPSPKIVVLAGSIRVGSINEKLAAAAARALSDAGADVSHISLRDYPLPLYDADLQAREGIPAPARALVDLFLEHRGAFVASPEYNASFSPLLKNAFDWMSRVNVAGLPPLPAFKTKVFALGAASNGALGGLRGLTQLRAMMELGLGALVLPEMVAVGNAPEAFSADGALVNPRAAGFLEAVVARLADHAERLA
ncbi:NADPH-dependent FMN reductase [Hansschlegelia sp. KR7-227]|uniref:NADPH-dependent FMN reductase n=1 Tax=Hansschlegelia sp. KR7-227 TaxID=3400914 RepID=UPI003C04ECF3